MIITCEEGFEERLPADLLLWRDGAAPLYRSAVVRAVWECMLRTSVSLLVIDGSAVALVKEPWNKISYIVCTGSIDLIIQCSFICTDMFKDV